MSDKIYQEEAYKELVIKNCYNTLEFLLIKNLDFMIISYTNVIEFNPEIPEDIATFDESSLFIISGYTKESARLTDEYLIFEAGFGNSNYGSILKIPLEAIMQIVLDEDVLHINYFEPIIKEENFEEISLQSLLNNPENQKLLKKRIEKK